MTRIAVDLARRLGTVDRRIFGQNSFEHPRAVDVRERRLPASGGPLEHEFPAHSVTVLRLPVGA